MMKELPIPESARNDLNSIEVLRVWVAHQQQHVSLKIGVWNDPAAYGLLLCDLARHFANAYQQEQGLDFDATLARIRAGFDAEMNYPTDMPKGGIVEN